MVRLLSMTHIFLRIRRPCDCSYFLNTLYKYRIFLTSNLDLQIIHSSSMIPWLGPGKDPSAHVQLIVLLQLKWLKNPSQTRVSEWGSLLPPEPENQAPRIPSEYSLSSFVDSNLGFHDSVQDSAPRKAILDSHNTLDQVPTPESRATLSSTISQPAAIVPLAPAVTTTALDFSKYPDYILYTYWQTSKWMDLGTWLWYSTSERS